MFSFYCLQQFITIVSHLPTMHISEENGSILPINTSQYYHAALGSPMSCLFSGQNKPSSFSYSLQGKYSAARTSLDSLNIFLVLGIQNWIQYCKCDLMNPK